MNYDSYLVQQKSGIYPVTKFCLFLCLTIWERFPFLFIPLTILWFGTQTKYWRNLPTGLPTSLWIFFQSICCPVTYCLTSLKGFPLPTG